MDLAHFLTTDTTVTRFLKEMRCVICRKVPLRPFRCYDDGQGAIPETSDEVENGNDCHMFCGECAASVRPGKCPGGNHIFKYLKRETLAQKLIQGQRVRCKRFQGGANSGCHGKLRLATGRVKGCEWVGFLKDLARHLETECAYEIVKCDACGVDVRRGSLDLHRSQCGTVDVRCEFCKMRMKAKDVSAHWKSCELMWIECPNKCIVDSPKRSRTVPLQVTKLKRKDLSSHRQICSEELVSCAFSKLGCTERVTRRLKRKHEIECMDTHLNLLLGELEKRPASCIESQQPVGTKRMRPASAENGIPCKFGDQPDLTGVATCEEHDREDKCNHVRQKDFSAFVSAVHRKHNETTTLISNLRLDAQNLKTYVEQIGAKADKSSALSQKSTMDSKNIASNLKHLETRLTMIQDSFREMKSSVVDQKPQKLVTHTNKCQQQLGGLVFGNYRWAVLPRTDNTFVTSTPVSQSGLTFVFTSASLPNGKGTSFHIYTVDPVQCISNQSPANSTYEGSCFKAKVVAKVTGQTHRKKNLCTRIFRGPQVFHSKVGFKLPNMPYEVRQCWGWSEFLNESMDFSTKEPLEFHVTLITSTASGPSEIDNIENLLALEQPV